MAKKDENLIKLPPTCQHGNRFRAFTAARVGTVVYDPGCRNAKTLRMRPHTVTKNGIA